MGDYSGIGLTNNVLQITVTGDSDADAEARAKRWPTRSSRTTCSGSSMPRTPRRRHCWTSVTA